MSETPISVDYEPAAPAADSLQLLTAGELIKRFPDQAAATIEGLARRGEVMNIIGVPKSRKSWLAMALSICYVANRAFLGIFKVAGGKALLIDNELHPGSIGHRIPRVAKSLGVLSHEYQDLLTVLPLRGTGKTLDDLEQLIHRIRPGEYGLIVLDAIYRFYPEGFDENSNADWTVLMNRIDRWAAKTQATIILIHHSSKGNQSGKSVTDTGAGAGAQSRAADAHLVIREHEEKDCAVLQAALRSWEPLEPIGLRWVYPTWTYAGDLDVTRLKRDPSKGGRPRKSETKPEVEEWTPERFVAEFVTDTPRSKSAIETAAKRQKITLRETSGLIDEAEANGLMFVHRRQGSNAKFYATAKPAKEDSVSRARTPIPPRVRERKTLTHGN